MPGGKGRPREAAQIAAVLSERGLGGDSVDLDARLDQFRRDRSQRASAARASRRSAGCGSVGFGRRSARGESELSTGVLLSLAFPDRVARNRGNGIVRAGERPRRCDRADLGAGARALSRGRRTDRRRRERPHSAGGADRACRDRAAISPTRSKPTTRSPSIAASMSLRGRRKRKLHAITLGEQTMRLSPRRRHARDLRRRLCAAGARAPAMVEGAAAVARPRDVPAQGGGRRLARPVRRGARRRTATTGLSRCCTTRRRWRRLSASDLSDAVMALLPWDLRARLDREAPTHFEAPTGSQVAIDYEAEQGPTIAIRVQELFGLERASVDRAGQGAAGGRIAVAGAPAGAGDARSAGLLARQLCRRARRSARPLSAPSLAGRSGQRAADAPGQAARDLNGRSRAAG